MPELPLTKKGKWSSWPFRANGESIQFYPVDLFFWKGANRQGAAAVQPHDLAGVQQQGIADFLFVSGVIVAVADQVVLTRFRKRTPNFGVMGDGDLASL